MPWQACWSEWLTYFIVCLCTTSHWCASAFVRFASLQLIVRSRRAVHRSSLAHISSQHNDRWRGKQRSNSDGQIKSIGSVCERQTNEQTMQGERAQHVFSTVLTIARTHPVWSITESCIHREQGRRGTRAHTFYWTAYKGWIIGDKK